MKEEVNQMRLIDADKIEIDCMTNKGTAAVSQSQLANAPTYDLNELFDNIGEYLFNSRYASEKIADFDFDQTVTFTRAEWYNIVKELKADIYNGCLMKRE